MAYGYDDGGNPIAVPTLAGANTFTGSQLFSANVASTSTTTGTVVITGGLGVQGNVYAGKVYGTVWNDLADCIDVSSDIKLEPGKCYCFDGNDYKLSSKYLDDGFIGIHSDTAGFYMGHNPDKNQLYAAVAGFVLAYVDKEYPAGTPLTCTENGYLTKLNDTDIAYNHYKIIATYWKSESEESWGSDEVKVKVNGRRWVKIR